MQALLCAAVALAPLAAAPTITVDAGALDRQATPVAFPIPPELGTGPFELRDARGRRLPLVVQGKDRQGLFVLPALAKGKRAELRLQPAIAPTKPALAIERQADALVVTLGGAPVFHFRTRAPAPTEEVPARFTRAGYLHPVFSPGGVVVTDDSPKDHGHHHGIWTAWTVTEYEGRRLSFWGPDPARSKNDLVAVSDVWTAESAAGFTARLASTDLSVKPPKQILDSQWKVVVWRTHDRRPPYYLFDLDWTDTIVGDKPLLLPEYRYGGLGVRGNREWLDPNKVTFLTSEGKDRLAGENTRARWVHLGGSVGGKGKKTTGLAVLIHPLNLRAPEPVRLNPGIPLLCVSPPKAGPLSIAPGHPYSARYRFVITDGPANPALLERLWRDFARAPVVEVQGARPAAEP
jgi:hypothetical protein